MRSGYRTPTCWRWRTDGIVRASDQRAYVDGRFVRVSLAVGKVVVIVEVANDISARRSEPNGRNRHLYPPEPVSITVLTSRQRAQPRK